MEDLLKEQVWKCIFRQQMRLRIWTGFTEKIMIRAKLQRSIRSNFPYKTQMYETRIDGYQNLVDLHQLSKD